MVGPNQPSAQREGRVTGHHPQGRGMAVPPAPGESREAVYGARSVWVLGNSGGRSQDFCS